MRNVICGTVKRTTSTGPTRPIAPKTHRLGGLIDEIPSRREMGPLDELIDMEERPDHYAAMNDRHPDLTIIVEEPIPCPEVYWGDFVDDLQACERDVLGVRNLWDDGRDDDNDLGYFQFEESDQIRKLPRPEPKIPPAQPADALPTRMTVARGRWAFTDKIDRRQKRTPWGGPMYEINQNKRRARHTARRLLALV